MCSYSVSITKCLQCIPVSMQQKTSSDKLEYERKSEMLMCDLVHMLCKEFTWY